MERAGAAAGSPGLPEGGGDRGVLTLSEGVNVPYRPIRFEDSRALQRFHKRLSVRSVYLRYFAAKPELGDKGAWYFTHVDGTNRFALVALDPERPTEIIGVASFDREGDTDRAEYAAAVEDRWQGRGVGLALTKRLVEAALRRDVRVLTGVLLPENARMLNLLRDLGLPERLRFEDGVDFVEVDLAPAAGGRTRETTASPDGP